MEPGRIFQQYHWMHFCSESQRYGSDFCTFTSRPLILVEGVRHMANNGGSCRLYAGSAVTVFRRETFVEDSMPNAEAEGAA